MTRLVCPSGDHYPGLIAPDITTNPDLVGDTRLGSNRTLASVVGFPAVSVPSGFTDDRMPVGLEFMGRAFEDAKDLELRLLVRAGDQAPSTAVHHPAADAAVKILAEDLVGLPTGVADVLLGEPLPPWR